MDFEGTEKIQRYAFANQWWGHIRGTTSSGFIVPDDLENGIAFVDVEGLQLQELRHSQAGNAQNKVLYDNNPDQFLLERIITTTGRLGTPTRVFYSRVIENNQTDDPRSTNPQDEDIGIVRSNYFVNPESTAVIQRYLSYWIKTPTNLYQMMKSDSGNPVGPGSFYALFEIKNYSPATCGDSDQDLRWGVTIDWFPNQGMRFAVSSETLNVATCNPSNEYWEVLAPLNNPTVIPGEWIKVEIFWKQGGIGVGRIWVRIKNVVICDRSDIFTHRGALYARKYNLTKHYVDPQIVGPGSIPGKPAPEMGYASEAWIDEIEIWDDIPNP